MDHLLPRVLQPETCVEFVTTRMVDPCISSSWQIDIQGKSLSTNKENNGWVYQDDEGEGHKIIETVHVPSSIQGKSLSTNKENNGWVYQDDEGEGHQIIETVNVLSSNPSVPQMSAPFPNVALEEQCFNPAGVAVGPKGLQNIRPRNTFFGTIFVRRGNECPCSFVSLSSSLP
jgi:hypothetical protein